MQGGIIGPWIVGVLVERTGGYDTAMQLFGLIMCVAAGMAYGTRGWESSVQRDAGTSITQQSWQSPSREEQSGGARAVVELQGLLSHPAKD